jgi:hypothetical protein
MQKQESHNFATKEDLYRDHSLVTENDQIPFSLFCAKRNHEDLV